MKKLLAMMVCSCMVLTLVACGEKGSDEDVIKIGLNYEQTGSAATYGQDHVDGIQLAVDEINENGGINGKKIELVVMDNKTDTNEVVNVATTLIDDEEVVAILGPATSGATATGMEIGNKKGIPTLSASSTRDDIPFDKKGNVIKYGFKICYSDSYQGPILASFAIKKGATKAVIFGDATTDYSKGLSKSFKEQFTKEGGTIVSEVTYQEKDTDFQAQITKIKDLDFDLLFVPGYYQEAGLIIKQARQAGIDAMILGPDGFDSTDLVKLAETSNLNNVYFSTHFSQVDKSEEVVNFVEKFKKEYDKEPGCFNALGYDLAYYIADAIERCGDDITPDAIQEALADTKAKFTGVTGTFTMRKDHTPEKSIKIVELQNGEQVAVEEMDAK